MKALCRRVRASGMCPEPREDRAQPRKPVQAAHKQYIAGACRAGRSVLAGLPLQLVCWPRLRAGWAQCCSVVLVVHAASALATLTASFVSQVHSLLLSHGTGLLHG